jgi:hypothetical protein
MGLNVLPDVSTSMPVSNEKHILDLAKRQRIPNIHHHRQSIDLGRTLEIEKWVFRLRRQRNGPLRLKPICSDDAFSPPEHATTNPLP